MPPPALLLLLAPLCPGPAAPPPSLPPPKKKFAPFRVLSSLRTPRTTSPGKLQVSSGAGYHCSTRPSARRGTRRGPDLPQLRVPEVTRDSHRLQISPEATQKGRGTGWGLAG